MRPTHVFLALIFALCWGMNFIAIKMSLETFPPFFQQGMRFLGATFPLVFFLPRPYDSWKTLMNFSGLLWVAQLSFITLGLASGASPGLSALLLQAKTLVVIILAVLFYGYKPRTHELVGLGVSLAGLTLVILSLAEHENAWAYLYIVPAIFSVSFANLAFKKEKNDPSQKEARLSLKASLSTTVWCAFLATPPLFLISFLVEGPQEIIRSFDVLNLQSVLALLYSVMFSTLTATTIYVFLLKNYGPERIIPFNLVIPVISMIVSSFIYQEEISLLQGVGIVCMLGGLLLNQLRPSKKLTLPLWIFSLRPWSTLRQ